MELKIGRLYIDISWYFIHMEFGERGLYWPWVDREFVTNGDPWSFSK